MWSTPNPLLKQEISANWKNTFVPRNDFQLEFNVFAHEIPVQHLAAFAKLIEGQPNPMRGTVMPGMGIPMLEIGRPNSRLVFDMEIIVPGWGGLCVETAPWALCYSLRHVA